MNKIPTAEFKQSYFVTAGPNLKCLAQVSDELSRRDTRCTNLAWPRRMNLDEKKMMFRYPVCQSRRSILRIILMAVRWDSSGDDDGGDQVWPVLQGSNVPK